MALQSTIAIANITLQSNSSEVVFSGIPNTYRDLIIVGAVRSVATNTNGIALNMTFNGDLTASNYAFVSMEGGTNGTRSLSGADAYIARINSSQSSNVDLTTVMIQIMDYTQTNKHKAAISRSSGKDGASDFGLTIHGYRWSNTNPITSVRLASGNGDFPAGVSFSLYGRIA